MFFHLFSHRDTNTVANFQGLNTSVFVIWFVVLSKGNKSLTQGMVDGSASKPTLRQDTGYKVEKTGHYIAKYLGAFGAYLMPQWPIYGSKGVSIN